MPLDWFLAFPSDDHHSVTESAGTCLAQSKSIRKVERRNAGGGKTKRKVQAAGNLRRNIETAGPGEIETETGRSHRRIGGGRGGEARRNRNLGDVTIVASDTSLTAPRMIADLARKTGGRERRLR